MWHICLDSACTSTIGESSTDTKIIIVQTREACGSYKRTQVLDIMALEINPCYGLLIAFHRRQVTWASAVFTDPEVKLRDIEEEMFEGSPSIETVVFQMDVPFRVQL